MSFDARRVLSSSPTLESPAERRMFTGQVAGFIDNPIADCLVTAETDPASPRTVTLQVRDRLNVPWKARWWVRITFGTAQWEADPALTIAFTTAAITVELRVDEVYDLLTDANGVIELTMDGSVDTYYLTACVLGRAQSATVALSAAARTSGALAVDPEILAVL